MSASSSSSQYFVPNSISPAQSPEARASGSMSDLDGVRSRRVPFPSHDNQNHQNHINAISQPRRTSNKQTANRQLSTHSTDQLGKGSVAPVTPPPDYSEPVLPRFSRSFPSLYNNHPDDDCTPPNSPERYTFPPTSPAESGSNQSPSSFQTHRRTVSQTTTTLRTETTRVRYSVSSTWDSDSDNTSLPGSSKFSTIQSTTTSTTSPSGSWPSRSRGLGGNKKFPVGSNSRQASPTPFSLRGRSNSTSSSRKHNNHNPSPARQSGSPRPRTGRDQTGSRRATQSMFGSSSQPTFAGKGADRTSYFSTGSIKNGTKAGQSRAGTKTFSGFADRTRRAQPRGGSARGGEGPFVSAFGPEAVTALTDNTLPYFKPFMNLFIFLIVSTVTAVSVSCVLLASFSLTFYDDLRRGVGAGRLQIGDSFEGMRAGARRVLGGAKDALDVVTRAANATRVRTSDHREVPTWHTASEGDEETPRHTSTRFSTSRPTGPTHRSPSCSDSTFRKGFATAGRQAPPTRFDDGPATPNFKDEFDRSWLSDEAPPFDVPPTTPRHSRPATPKPGSSPGSPRLDRTDRLPPRPPLKVLVPSVVFALVWTVMQLVCNWWSGRAGPRGGRKGR